MIGRLSSLNFLRNGKAEVSVSFAKMYKTATLDGFLRQLRKLPVFLYLLKKWGKRTGSVGGFAERE